MKRSKQVMMKELATVGGELLPSPACTAKGIDGDSILLATISQVKRKKWRLNQDWGSALSVYLVKKKN